MTLSDDVPTFYAKDNIIYCPETRKMDNKGLGQHFYEKLTQHKDIMGQIDGLTGKKETFGDILQRSVRLAIEMRRRGITSDDIITICSTLHLDTFIPELAALFLGVKFANTDPDINVDDTSHLLNMVKPKMIFVSSNAIDLMESVLRKTGLDAQIVVFGDGESKSHAKFSELLVESPEEEANFKPVEVDQKDTAMIFFTSGTSGLPKGICLSHLSIMAQLRLKIKGNVGSSATCLGFGSAYWLSSIVMLTICITAGAPRLVLPKFNENEIWNHIKNYNVIITVLAPRQLTKVLKSGRPSDANTSSLKVLNIGGACVDEEQMKATRNMFPATFIGFNYGQTELGGACAEFSTSRQEDLKLYHQNITSCGRPVSGMTYKVVDVETDEPLGPNRKGELLVKSPYNMNGYYNKQKSNEWTADGFLRTGDLAYYDEDYCFYVVDRVKEMLKFQGFQIQPSKLEGILRTHPDVQETVVVGIPNPDDGDHPMAIVELKKNVTFSNTIAYELEKFVEKKVQDDKQRLRAGVVIVDKIPVTPSEKLKRNFTRDLVLTGKLTTYS